MLGCRSKLKTLQTKCCVEINILCYVRTTSPFTDDTFGQWFLTVSIPRPLQCRNRPLVQASWHEIRCKDKCIVGEFIDQTFHVVEHVKACAPLEIWRHAPQLRTTVLGEDNEVQRALLGIAKGSI